MWRLSPKRPFGPNGILEVALILIRRGRDERDVRRAATSRGPARQLSCANPIAAKGSWTVSARAACGVGNLAAAGRHSIRFKPERTRKAPSSRDLFPGPNDLNCGISNQIRRPPRIALRAMGWTITELIQTSKPDRRVPVGRGRLFIVVTLRKRQWPALCTPRLANPLGFLRLQIGDFRPQTSRRWTPVRVVGPACYTAQPSLLDGFESGRNMRSADGPAIDGAMARWPRHLFLGRTPVLNSANPGEAAVVLREMDIIVYL